MRMMRSFVATAFATGVLVHAGMALAMDDMKKDTKDAKSAATMKKDPMAADCADGGMAMKDGMKHEGMAAKGRDTMKKDAKECANGAMANKGGMAHDAMKDGATKDAMKK
jgi:hypothetical protein